jgi:membrane protein implicated in regulation of membrane protease activity
MKNMKHIKYLLVGIGLMIVGFAITGVLVYGILCLIPYIENFNWNLIATVFLICFGLVLSYMSGRDFIKQRAEKKYGSK